MAVFAVVTEDKFTPSNFPETLERAYPENFQVSRKCWLIAGKGLTTKKIAQEFGIETEPPRVEGVVIFRLTASYWGNAAPDLWEWLEANFE